MVLKLPPSGVVGAAMVTAGLVPMWIGGERHNGKAKNKAYPRVIRNS